METQLATRNVKVNDPGLQGLTEITLTFNCRSCGQKSTQKVHEVYAHFPQKHKSDNIVASFALPPATSKGLICDECVFK